MALTPDQENYLENVRATAESLKALIGDLPPMLHINTGVIRAQSMIHRVDGMVAEVKELVESKSR